MTIYIKTCKKKKYKKKKILAMYKDIDINSIFIYTYIHACTTVVRSNIIFCSF